MESVGRITFCFALVLILLVGLIQCRGGRGGGRSGGGSWGSGSGSRGSWGGGGSRGSWGSGSRNIGNSGGEGRKGSWGSGSRGNWGGGGSKGSWGSGSRSRGNTGGSWSWWRSKGLTVSGRPKTSLYSKSLYSGHRKTVNSDGFGTGKCEIRANDIFFKRRLF